jgi:uncharacterized repeat protein (TIGR01451 family)
MKPRWFFTLLLLAALLTGAFAPLAAGQEATGSPGATIAAPAAEQIPTDKKPDVPNPGLPVQGGVEGVAADYFWSQTTGTYTEITGGTLVTYSCDDSPSYGTYTIPFTFTYNGTAYTTFGIQCNGFIALGALPSSTYYPLSGGSTNNVVSALGSDLQTGLTNSELRYEVLGTSPSQVLVVQYKNFRHYGGSQVYNFQIRLYETSNAVEVVYGSFTETSTYSQQVGLRGSSNADFNNRKDGVLLDWTDSQPGTLNTSTMTLSTTKKPANGLTWDWTPVLPRPIFDTSSKTATGEVMQGGDIAYLVRIKNTGTADATAATMVDPIPAGTAYNGDVACTGGTCGFDGTNVTWSGTLPMGGQVDVTFSVNTTGLECGTIVVNEATLDDPGLIGGPVVKTASTLVTGMINDLVTAGFEDSVPPPGWTETIVLDPGTDPDWTRESVGAYPTINPHGGGYMAKFNSFNTGNGGQARLASPALDLTAVASPRVVFYMSHDTGYSGNADAIQVQASTDGGATWANVGSPIIRYDATYVTPGWGYHVVNLAGYGGQPSVMVGFLGMSAYGNNIFLDDAAIQDVCGHPMVMIWPDGAGSACPGGSVEYTLNVKNVNLVGDTIDVALSGNAWQTTVVPDSLALGPGETGQVVVTSHVLWSAAPGDSDVATVTATAQGTGETDSAVVTTTASGGGWDTAWVNQAVGGEPDLYWGHSYYYGGNVCVVGGLSGSGTIIVTGEHWCYNIAGAAWTAKAAMPYPLMAGAYGLIGDKFYIAGGFDINFNGYTYLQIYDIATDSWTTGAALPTARGGQAGGVVDGKLYSAGGSGTSSFPTDCPTYEYDPVVNAWATKAPCPSQGGYGFDLGGSVGSDFHGKLFAGGHFNTYYGWYAFDPAANTWQTLANLPIHKTPLIVEDPTTGEIYSIGGLIGWTGQNATWKYDYGTNAWTNLNLPLNTTQGGSLGPAHGSFGDPDFQGFWTEGGTIGSGAIAPAPFESWELVECPAPQTMHVNGMSVARGGPGPYALRVGGSVVDALGNGVDGVSVTLQWTLPNATQLYRFALTGAQGFFQSTVTYGQRVPGSYTVCVVQLEKAGYGYDRAANVPLPPCRMIVVP